MHSHAWPLDLSFASCTLNICFDQYCLHVKMALMTNIGLGAC